MASLIAIPEVQDKAIGTEPGSSPTLITTPKVQNHPSYPVQQNNLLNGLLKSVGKNLINSGNENIIRLLSKPRKNIQETIILARFFQKTKFFLRYKEIYDDLDEKEAFPAVFQQSSVLQIRPNQPIYRQDDDSNKKIYIIISGEVALIRRDPWMKPPKQEVSEPEPLVTEDQSSPLVYITEFNKLMPMSTRGETEEDLTTKNQQSDGNSITSPIFSPIISKEVSFSKPIEQEHPNKGFKSQRTRYNSRQLIRPQKESSKDSNPVTLPGSELLQGVKINPLARMKNPSEKFFQARDFGNITKTLHYHDYFGHDSLLEVEKRVETAFATKQTTLLVLDARSFKDLPENFSLLKKAVTQFILQAFPAFENVSTKQYETVLSLIDTGHYMADDQLTVEGKQGEYIYLIFEGACEMTKRLIYDCSQQQRDSMGGVEELYALKHTESSVIKVCNLERGSFIGEEILYPSRNLYETSVKVSSVRAIILKIAKHSIIWRFPSEIRDSLIALHKQKQRNNIEILHKKLTTMGLSFQEDQLTQPGPIFVSRIERKIYSPNSRPTSAKRPQSASFKLPLQQIKREETKLQSKHLPKEEKGERIGTESNTQILRTESMVDLIDYLHNQSSLSSYHQPTQKQQLLPQKSDESILIENQTQSIVLNTDRPIQSTPPRKRPLKFQAPVSSKRGSVTMSNQKNLESSRTQNDYGMIPQFETDTKKRINDFRNSVASMASKDQTPERENCPQPGHARTVSLRIEGSPNVAKYDDYVEYASTNFDYISNYLKNRDDLVRHVQLFSFNLNDIQEDIQRRRKTEKNKKIFLRKRMEEIHKLGHAEEVAIPNRKQLSTILISKVMKHTERYERSLKKHQVCSNFLKIQSPPQPQSSFSTLQSQASPKFDSFFVDTNVIAKGGFSSSRPTTAIPIPSRSEANSRPATARVLASSIPSSRPQTARVKPDSMILPDSSPSYPAKDERTPINANTSTKWVNSAQESTVLTRTFTASELDSLLIISNPIVQNKPTPVRVPSKMGRRTRSSGSISKKVGGFAVMSALPTRERDKISPNRVRAVKKIERVKNVKHMIGN